MQRLVDKISLRLRWITEPPPGPDPVRGRQVAVLHAILLCLALGGAGAAGLSVLVSPGPRALPGSVLFTIGCLGLLAFVRRGHHRWVSWAVVIGLFGLIVSPLVSHDGLEGTAPVTLLVVVLTATLLFGWAGGLLAATACTAAVSAMLLIQLEGGTAGDPKVALWLTLVTMFYLAAGLVTVADRARRQASLRASRAEMELLHALDAATASNVENSRFLETMSHELRTSLNAILGYSELLAEDAPSAEVIEDLGHIRTAGSHLLSLISDVLDLSKIAAGRATLRPDWVGLTPFFEGLDAAMGPAVRANNNRLVLSLDLDAESAYIDGLRVGQVVLNLLSNAAKFTNQGTITLGVRLVNTGSSGVLVIEVKDTGIGMDATVLDKLFQPFTQAGGGAGRRYGGSGLGLALSRSLTEMMGGTIHATSTLGHGSTFVVRLPVQVGRGSDHGMAQGPISTT